MKRKSKSDIQTSPKIHPQLTTYIGYCFHKAALRLRAHIDGRISEYGIVSPQYGMLMILSIDGPMTQIELGSYMAMDKATVVRMIDGLEEKGYLKRVQSAQDRRAKRLELTSSGRKLIHALGKLRMEAEREFLAPLNAEEKAQLKKIVAKLVGR
jgi:DNA-binding MarR family transcriptional regulator